MSHFSTLVCLPADTDLAKLEDALSDAMERWDESREVERYKDYEDGSPDEHWWAGALRRRAAKFGVATYESELAEARKRAQGWDRETPEQSAEKEMRDIEDAHGWAKKFGPGPWTWAQVAEAYNTRFPPDENDDELLVDEDGRAFTWSTRNPEAKWDYWRIGGRWRNYFIAKEWPHERLITTNAGWDSPKELKRKGCDGGPRGLLDFEAMRDAWADTRVGAYDLWQDIVRQHGNPPAWADLYGLVELKELDIDDARRKYNTHPAIEAARKAEIDVWGDSVEAVYGMPREEFIRLARLAAVPGYAIVTLDREWMAPGRMGWFGMSSDGAGEREVYHLEANRYLDALDPDAYVVALDLHI